MGPLERRYLEVRPGAKTGLDVCRVDQHRRRLLTHADLKSSLGSSDRTTREYLSR